MEIMETIIKTALQIAGLGIALYVSAYAISCGIINAFERYMKSKGQKFMEQVEKEVREELKL